MCLVVLCLLCYLPRDEEVGFELKEDKILLLNGFFFFRPKPLLNILEASLPGVVEKEETNRWEEEEVEVEEFTRTGMFL